MAENVPALRFRLLTPLYDRVTEVGLLGRPVREGLVSGAGIRPGHRVLDFGCGTGTLSLITKSRHPRATVVGVDVDRDVLALARAKSARAGLDVRWDLHDGTRLPYPDGDFDRALTSLVMHHIADKPPVLRELHRVLRPGGELHLLDIGPPRGTYARAVSPVHVVLEHSSDNVRGLLPTMIANAGFTEVAEASHHGTAFGTVCTVRAVRPMVDGAASQPSRSSW
jgi:SAM-dependent methyltransferase